MRKPLFLGALAALLVGAAAAGYAVYGGRDVAPAPAPAAAYCCPIRDADLATMTAHRADRMQVFRFAGNPLVLVIDFPGLAAQGRMMNRLASLIEKSHAPRDRVVGDGELDRLIGAGGDNPATYYFGHDYDATGLTRFYNLAALGAVELNAAELLLRTLLLQAGFMKETPSGYATLAPERAIVSVSQPQADDPATGQDEAVDADLRAAILRHELSHGEFFTNPGYRDYVAGFWKRQMTEAQRAGFRAFLAAEDYDVSDERLMMNEMQAYLVNTPDPRLFGADFVGLTDEEVETLAARFLAGGPPSALFDGQTRLTRREQAAN